ncbi:MAG: hypothetical protein ACK57O_07625, partial [Planctomyces sp.]
MKKQLRMVACALLLATASRLPSVAAPQDGGTPAAQPQTIAEIQTAAIASGVAEFGYWGTDPAKYTGWTSHSNRLIP